ncbi:MAG: MobF family relaxase [Cyanobacteria bacterium P01_C01_bin.121]
MLSNANVSAAQAANYYEKDDYYTQGDPDLESDSQWQGKGAAQLHLSGPVDKQTFQQLLHGQTPAGNNLHGRRIDPTKHRAATDYTFSAPKSVSIAALIQKDKRVIQAHDSAVKTALEVLENRYAQTRIRRGPGIRERVTTGNIIAATFRHETSREQDPQLHTHCVVINATQLENGKWQSISNDEALNNVKLLGEIYQNELAYQLQKIGYEIEPQGNGTFECKGYDKDVLNLFSTRSQQIENYIEKWEANLKEQGGKPLHPKQKKQATLATRLRKKNVPREVLLNGWEKSISTSENHLPNIPEIEPVQLQSQAATSATEGVSHAAERESVFKREKAERFALEHHLGEQSFSELQSAMTDAGLIAAKDRFTTEEAIERELDTIALMESGQGREDAISNLTDVLQLTENENTLTIGQYTAILETATSRDAVMAWQGVAGAGKTYSLKLLSQLATKEGYDVTGYAPSAQAANVLSEEANIEANTVARLLHSNDHNRPQSNDQITADKKAIWIVDEAGLLSAKDAHALLKKAQQNNARILLVGDTRQLSAVEAGNPFKSLQSAGMKTSYLEESRRQKTEALRKSVVCLAAGEQTEGLDQLSMAGMINEVKSSEERHQAITYDYLSLPPETRQKTLILSGTNVERLALTQKLRAVLQTEGSLGQDVFTLQSLRSRDRTAAQLKYASAYEVGDVVVPVKDYHRYGMKRRGQYRVTAKDLKSNRLILQGLDGRSFRFDPATCAAKTTYQVQQLAIGRGEQLRWTRNEAIKGVRNGQLVTVEEIDAKGTATLKDAKGETIAVELSGQQYLDYALVNTTYSSQGKTAEQVLADIDSTLSKEGLYVAVSRAKVNLKLYTADKQQLYKRGQRSAAKTNPSDYLPLFNLISPHAESQKAVEPTRELRGADQSEYIGDSTGERIAISHRAAVRRDPRIEAGSEPAAERTIGVTAEYVSDVRAVVAGIEERHQAEELAGRAERLGEAVEALVPVVEQLELTAAALAGLADQVERKAQRLKKRRLSPERTEVSGVAEVMLRNVDPELLARAKDRVAKEQAPELSKQQQRREVYRRYASKLSDRSPKDCDLIVACQLLDKLLKDRSGQRLTQDELVRVGRVLLEGPPSQALEQSRGREASAGYVTEVVSMAQLKVERAQRNRRSRQAERAQRKSRDRGMEL